MKTKLLRRMAARFGAGPRRVPAVEAYDRWAATYDAQPDNVIFALEAPLFTQLLECTPINGRIVVDVGCGEGRHWPEILSHSPAALIGVDPSRRMLDRLEAKHAGARLLCTPGDRLADLAPGACDVIVSTLALAHIGSPADALSEWSRVLRGGGLIVLTDFHPAAARAGMKRTFVIEGKALEIENHPTDLERLRRIAMECGLACVLTIERVIDESVRPCFERSGYLEAYEKHRGSPLVFGMQLLKPA